MAAVEWEQEIDELGRPDEIPVRASPPIVPPATVPGRSLALVIAIMTYLACLTIGAVSILARTAEGWEAEVASELTVQVAPVGQLDLEAEVAKAAEIVRTAPGVAAARVLSPAENSQLLEPWLGGGLDLSTLPVPRLVVVKVEQGASVDLRDLRRRLSSVRGASLDDHRMWQERLGGVARTIIGLGLAVLGLVLTATVLTVIFATRGAMASNRDVVQVLDLVGASQSFIAKEFQRHFLLLGFRGALLGGAGAMLTFAGARLVLAGLGAPNRPEAEDAFFGSFALDLTGYAGALAMILVVASLAAVTSRLAVVAALRRAD